jgi:uncharacterized protein (TIGR02147 family)
MASDHLIILQSELHIRRQRNPSYSLRSFGRDLGIAPSALSSLLQGKKGLSEKKAASIALKIGLRQAEQELFLLSARARYARKKASRVDAAAELASRKKSHALPEPEIALAQHWYHQAILELTELKDCNHTAEWFARRLNLSLAQAQSALALLQKIGWLECIKGRYSAKWAATAAASEIPSQAIKGFHRQILAKADQALQDQDLAAREFQSTTFAFDAKKMKEAKKAIRDFQHKFSHEFYSASKTKNSIYQISIQFFRLDEEVT